MACGWQKKTNGVVDHPGLWMFFGHIPFIGASACLKKPFWATLDLFAATCDGPLLGFSPNAESLVQYHEHMQQMWKKNKNNFDTLRHGLFWCFLFWKKCRYFPPKQSPVHVGVVEMKGHCQSAWDLRFAWRWFTILESHLRWDPTNSGRCSPRFSWKNGSWYWWEPCHFQRNGRWSVDTSSVSAACELEIRTRPKCHHRMAAAAARHSCAAQCGSGTLSSWVLAHQTICAPTCLLHPAPNLSNRIAVQWWAYTRWPQWRWKTQITPGGAFRLQQALQRLPLGSPTFVFCAVSVGAPQGHVTGALPDSSIVGRFSWRRTPKNKSWAMDDCPGQVLAKKSSIFPMSFLEFWISNWCQATKSKNTRSIATFYFWKKNQEKKQDNNRDTMQKKHQEKRHKKKHLASFARTVFPMTLDVAKWRDPTGRPFNKARANPVAACQRFLGVICWLSCLMFVFWLGAKIIYIIFG